MNKLIVFLSNRYTSIVILFLSIAARVVNILFVSYYGRDKLFLVMQARSFLQGKGLGVPQYLTSNSLIPVYDYTPLWPPGYPVLLAPFLKVFNYNIYWSTTSLDIIFCVALIFVIRYLCRLIELPVAAINIMTLIAGCFEYTFINESLPTDPVSIVLSLLSLIFLIKLLASNKFSLTRILFVSFLIFFPCFFRYNYPAISLSLAGGVLFIGLIKKDILFKRKAVWLSGFTVLFIACFFLMMKAFTGHAGYALPTQRGLFPENIVHWFPFVPSALINIAFLTSQATHVFNLSFKTSMLWLEVINVISVLLLLIFFTRFLFYKKEYKDLSSLKIFMILGSFASLGLLALLGYMSLTYKIQTGFFNNWNYVYEPRYFAFVVLFLQIAFLAWYFKKVPSKNFFSRSIAAICFFALFIEISHNIYFYSKVAFNFKKYKSEVFREQDFSYYISLIGDIGNKYPGVNIWAAAPGDNFYQYLATYHGYTGIADVNNIKTRSFTLNNKTILILMLYDHEVNGYKEFLSGVTILHTEKKSNSNFYIIELNP